PECSDRVDWVFRVGSYWHTAIICAAAAAESGLWGSSAVQGGLFHPAAVTEPDPEKTPVASISCNALIRGPDRHQRKSTRASLRIFACPPARSAFARRCAADYYPAVAISASRASLGIARNRRRPMPRIAEKLIRNSTNLLTMPKSGMNHAHVTTLKLNATNTFTAADANIRPAQRKPTITAMSGTTAFASGGR